MRDFLHNTSAHSGLLWRHFVVLVVVACSATVMNANEVKIDDSPNAALARTFASLIEDAIPTRYEKKKDWGRTKQITAGLRNEGHGLHLHRRKKSVRHGTWKHYQLRLVEPEKNLVVRLENLRGISAGRIGFTLVLHAKLDTWARAKVYQYGIHLIALEVEGDTQIYLELDCEVGVKILPKGGSSTLAIDPKVVDARVHLQNFRIRRVSNAKGPLVAELSSGVRKLIQHELNGPKLTAKLNRSIDQRRDRLQLGLGDLWDSPWWPLGQLPEVQHAVRSR